MLPSSSRRCPLLPPPELIPAKFIRLYVTESELNSQNAIIFGPWGKFWRMELNKNQSGVFFAGGWSEFLAFHSISKFDVVLLRHEGNMVFKLKVFGPNGCQKDFKEKDIKAQKVTDIENPQEAPSSIRNPSTKRPKTEGSSHQGNKEIKFIDIEKSQEAPSSFRNPSTKRPKTKGSSHRGNKKLKKILVCLRDWTTVLDKKGDQHLCASESSFFVWHLLQSGWVR